MRLAIVSDIHGNLTALEAIIADLGKVSPDVILHGGDLADNGSSPVEVIDRIRDLGWPGVAGNTDEMLFAPQAFADFAAQVPALRAMSDTIEHMAADCREALGENRLAWLRSLPLSYNAGPVALVHASPVSLWRAPGHTASDKELEAAYGPLGQPVAAYGHTHVPYIRAMGSLTVANCGSAGLPYDGDRRASYLLVDGETPCIRRVEYDVDREVRALGAGGRPQAEWVARMLQAARPQLLSVAG